MSPGLRDHEPVIIEQFGGLWARGDAESAPSDHFTRADNVQYFNSGVETRDPLDLYQVTVFIGPILRSYNYVMQTGQSLLVLNNLSQIYHVISPTVFYGPILTVPFMEDFGFVAYNGNAYITPFKSYTNASGETYQLGLLNEYVYVYKGTGTAARRAGGRRPRTIAPPPGADSFMIVANGVAGLTDSGNHLFAIVYETDTGYLTAIGPVNLNNLNEPVFSMFNMTGVNVLTITGVPVPLDTFVKKIHLVSTKAIPTFNGDPLGYQFFFVPNATIDLDPPAPAVPPVPSAVTPKGYRFDGIQFFDSDLVSDASHLLDNFENIPAGVNLNIYHSRMIVVGEYGTTTPDNTLANLPDGITDNRSIARVSAPGEPEAFSKVDGLIIAPLDGNALTNVQEFRDVLYLFKKTRTYAYVDNQDVPATWQEDTLDQGIGAPVHGIATVLDSGGVNIDFLLIADWSGLMLFNGTYARPELSWKIEDIWLGIDRNLSHHMQVVNDSLTKKIWLTIPEPNRHIMLHADYNDGMDARNIKWAKWIFDVKMSTCTLIKTNRLILGASAISDVTDTPFDFPTPTIYYINPTKTLKHDSYYADDRKIPNPTIRLALLGE